MRLLSLTLDQFRSYEKLELDLSSGSVHVFVGENGAGKTNILEAVSILSLAKSCLGSDEADIAQWDTDFYRVRGEAANDLDETRQLEVVSQQVPRPQKACFLNDVKRGLEEIIGMLPTVTFLPQELMLFSGTPANRRKFLDRLLCQVSPEYLQALSHYQKALKQRNTLLKKINEGQGSATDLLVWDQYLVEQAVPVTLARLELIGTLQLTLPQEVASLGEESWENVAMVYQRKGAATDTAGLTKEYRDLLEQNQRRDVALQSTSVGPHREDWNLEVDGRQIDTFASRGQQRAALLALLLLQVSYLQLRCGEKPIILLDDVFSELDDHHQASLLESLSGYQVIITTTHVPAGKEKAVLWQVKEGKVEAMDMQAVA